MIKNKKPKTNRPNKNTTCEEENDNFIKFREKLNEIAERSKYWIESTKDMEKAITKANCSAFKQRIENKEEQDITSVSFQRLDEINQLLSEIGIVANIKAITTVMRVTT